jgi:hypothetical protein
MKQNWKDFIAELVYRYTSKSPKLFIWIQNISLVLMFVRFMPDILSDFNIILPEKTTLAITRIIGICSTVSLIISKLPVDESA